MPSRTEKQRRKQAVKDSRWSAEDHAKLASDFEQKVVLGPEYYDLYSEEELPTRNQIQPSINQKAEKQRTNINKKMLGDAGEHYAITKFAFSGIPGAKMPENWPEYDFVLEDGTRLLKVAVKTRSETFKFSRSSWFIVNANSKIDWSVFIINFRSGEIRSWIIPQDRCLEHATPKDKSIRHISWHQLELPELAQYRENWKLNR
jgi:hypothetical protein